MGDISDQMEAQFSDMLGYSDDDHAADAMRFAYLKPDWAAGAKEPPALTSPTDNGERGGPYTRPFANRFMPNSAEVVMHSRQIGKTNLQNKRVLKSAIINRLVDYILRGYKNPGARLMQEHPDLRMHIEDLTREEVEELQRIAEHDAYHEEKRREAKGLGKPGYMRQEPISVRIHNPEGDWVKDAIERAKDKIMKEMQVPSYMLKGHSEPTTQEPIQSDKPKGTSTMKSKLEMRNTAAILSDDIVSVECKFSKNATKIYTYKCRKDLAETLSKGDVVVVGHSAQPGAVVIVSKVHNECDLPNAADQDYNWIVQAMDTGELEALQKWDEEAEQQLYKMQRQHQKAQLMKNLNLGTDVDNVAFALPAPASDVEVIDVEEDEKD